jgi:release factor glutamine methyltransferase
MRKLFKKLASLFLVPLTRWYLRKKRKYAYRQTTVSVLPGVFHPGLFSSTGLLLGYVEQKIIPGETLLEIGSGTGLISVIASKKHARVTALDKSLAAIENTALNAKANNVKIDVIQSDLFESLSKKQFDWIVINPPYYARDPETEGDLAWYCGKEFQYFKKLFTGLPEVMHPASQVIMVLTMGCDLKQIFSIGGAAGFRFQLLKEKKAFFDGKDMLYSLQAKAFDKVAT